MALKYALLRALHALIPGTPHLILSGSRIKQGVPGIRRAYTLPIPELWVGFLLREGDFFEVFCDADFLADFHLLSEDFLEVVLFLYPAFLELEVFVPESFFVLSLEDVTLVVFFLFADLVLPDPLLSAAFMTIEPMSSGFKSRWE
jgi:hypothetical protein